MDKIQMSSFVPPHHTEDLHPGSVSENISTLENGAVPVCGDFGIPHPISSTPDLGPVPSYRTGGTPSNGDKADIRMDGPPDLGTSRMKSTDQDSGTADLSDNSLVLQDFSHTVTCTITVAFATPALPNNDDDNPIQGQKGNKSQKQPKKLIGSPKGQAYYHFEYHLLPEHTEPTKVDVVLFGVVAKLYIDHESRLLKPWFESGRTWFIWSHNVELRVTKDAILKTLSHQIQVKIWDTKDKVSLRARFDKPKAFRVSQEKPGDDPEVKLAILNQRKLFADSQPKPSFSVQAKEDFIISHGDQGLKPVPEQVDFSSKIPCAMPPVPFSTLPSQKYPTKRSVIGEDDFGCMSAGSGQIRKSGTSPDDKQSLEATLQKHGFNVKSVKHHRTDAVSSKSRKKSADASKHEKPSSALSSQSERKCLTLTVSLMALLAGELSVVERFPETSDKVLDGYISMEINSPLLSEGQKRELNPLVIRILSATSLPAIPSAIQVLQESCVPVYCRYKFHHQPYHETRGQEHGSHVYFKDVNVILAGTISPGVLCEYLNGPPLEIEVHDRDRKKDEGAGTSSPSLYGKEPEDEKLSNVGLVAARRTVHNPFTGKERSWDPYGIAKVGLSELVQGAKYLNMYVPIQNSAAPDPSEHNPDVKNGKIIRVVGSVDGARDSPLPVGHYLDAHSVLKVRVDIAVPLSAEAEAPECPYGRIIYVFDYKERKLFNEIVRKISEINIQALDLEHGPACVTQDVLSKVGLKDEQKTNPSLDVVTGFHVTDRNVHLFVLEGLKHKGIKNLWEAIPSRPLAAENVDLDILYNSRLSFSERIYKDLDVLVSHIHLHDSLASIMKQPLLYIRDMVPCSSFQALSRLNYICSARKLRDVIQNDLLPSAEMIRALSREFGVPASLPDILCETEDKLSKKQDRGRTSDFKRSALRCSLQNKNPKYVKWKREHESSRDYVQCNIERLYHLNRTVPQSTDKYIAAEPADGQCSHNYSCQSFNSIQSAQNILRQEMTKEPRQSFTYCQDYHSATVSRVDVEEEKRNIKANSKRRWMTPTGFLYPGHRSSIESNSHPKHPDEARVMYLSKAWKENILHANILQPTLARERWSWDERLSDFDLYMKYQERFSLFVPGAIHLPGRRRQEEERAAEQAAELKWLQNIKVDNLRMRFYRRLPETELTSHGPRASDQQSRLIGLLKDQPAKLSLQRGGLALKPVPALAVLPSSGVNDNNVASGSGFAPGDDTSHSLTWDRNIIPRNNMDHPRFQQLKGKDFELYSSAHSPIHKRGIKDLSPEERDAFLFTQETAEDPPRKQIPDSRNIRQTQSYAGFLLHIQ
ncbi:uncharacterized protein CFAP92 [Pelodytes ibericus]